MSEWYLIDRENYKDDIDIDWAEAEVDICIGESDQGAMYVTIPFEVIEYIKDRVFAE